MATTLIDEVRKDIEAESLLPSECPKCHDHHIVRSGHARGRQRYECQNCHFHYTTGHRGKPPGYQRMALHLYLEGEGFRSIGRLLGVSNVAVMNWIHQFAEKLDPIRKPPGVELEIVEIDEMYSFIQQKKTAVGSGSLWIGSATDSSASFWVHGPAAPASDSGGNSTTPKAPSES